MSYDNIQRHATVLKIQAQLGVPHSKIHKLSLASSCNLELVRFSILLRLQDGAKVLRAQNLFWGGILHVHVFVRGTYPILGPGLIINLAQLVSSSVALLAELV